MYVVKSARKEDIRGWESCTGNKKKYVCFVYYLCVCYTTQDKQTRCLVKTQQVLVPLKIINGQKQIGDAFGELRYEQNHRNDKKRKGRAHKLGLPESALTTCTTLTVAVHSQLI